MKITEQMRIIKEKIDEYLLSKLQSGKEVLILIHAKHSKATVYEVFDIKKLWDTKNEK